MSRALLALGLAIAGAAGCTVDTETGVGADVLSTDVSFAGTGIDATIALQMTVRFHVGEHVMDARTFIPLRVDLFVGEQLVGTVNLDRPPGFDNTLEPGESETVDFTGSGFVANATARDLACDPASMLTINIRWDDMTADEISMDSITTNDVTCM
jgi:hypothetical protein